MKRNGKMCALVVIGMFVSMMLVSYVMAEPPPSALPFWGLDGNEVGPDDFLGTTNEEDLRFVTNGEQRMVITSDGNVGIGTTSPNGKLEVVGDIVVSGLVDGVDIDVEVANLHATDIALQAEIDDLEAEDALDYDSLGDIEAAVANGFNIATASGYVGIGTASPGAKLDVDLGTAVWGVGGAATIGHSDNAATGDYAIAMGYLTTASGGSSIAMGYKSTASGEKATAMGYETTASFTHSTAMGDYTTASGYASTAMGTGTTASAGSSTAMGHKTTASGYASTAMGDFTTASGGHSTAMGWYTTASGICSTAIGREIEAKGDYTVAIALGDQDGLQVTQHNTMAIMGGNVGIGTIDPTEKLEVDGNVKATSYFGDGSSLTGVVKTESDPVFTASPANGITLLDITNWNTAYGWGDHSLQNYLRKDSDYGASDGQVLKWDDATGIWIPGDDDSGPWTVSAGSSVDGSLVGLWHMDEGIGSTISDETENGNDGTINGATWTTGKYGNALSFDGTDDYATIPDSASLDVADQITLAAWVKFNVDPYSITQSRSFVIDKYYAYRLWYSANGEGTSDPDQFFLDLWDWQGVNTQGITWEQDEWFHIVATYDGSTARIYVNGELNNENSFTKILHTSNNAFVIGTGAESSSFWNGDIDEAAIWGRALSDPEVEDVYNNDFSTDEECIYYNTGNVGIGTDTPSEKLEIAGTVKATSFLSDGNVGIGTASPGAKLDVEVSYGGAATIGSSDNTATGDFAIAMGYGTNANGHYSTAMGGGTTVSGSYSTAMGGGTTASGPYSTAMGGGTTASGYVSTAMGVGTTASGWYSTAMGVGTTASGSISTAMGRGIEARGDYTVAIALSDQNGLQVTQSNTMAIMGGNVGIGTVSPAYTLDVEGDVQAHSYHTGDIFFQVDDQDHWRMYEDENGLYVENLETGITYSFVLQEIPE